jgi:cell filamentation protein
MPESSDPYLYPGTDVLRNIPDICDPDSLAAFEANWTTARLVELATAHPRGGFDIPHLKAIHRRLFQDVYRWAGEVRTVNISKGGHLFGAAAFLESALSATFVNLAEEDFLRGLDSSHLADRAGYCLGEINAAHPFREGNGRTQREFIRQLCLRAGFPVDWNAVSPDEMMAASQESSRSGNNSGLAGVILKAMRRRS